MNLEVEKLLRRAAKRGVRIAKLEPPGFFRFGVYCGPVCAQLADSPHEARKAAEQLRCDNLQKLKQAIATLRNAGLRVFLKDEKLPFKQSR